MNPLAITAAARETPGRIALIYRGRSYSFAELAEMTRGVVDAIVARAQTGAAADRTGDDRCSGAAAVPAPLAVVATPTLGTVLAIYAALEVGTTCVLFHDRSTSAERRVQRELCRALSPGPVDRPRIVIFTSGSSGTAKGVVLGGEAFAASATASVANLGWRQDDRWLCCLPLAHAGGLSILTRCLLGRRSMVVDAGRHFAPQRIARCIADQRITLLSLVPTMLARLIDHGWSAPPHLRAVLLGGAAAAPALLERASSRGIPVLTTYGMSEACSQICTQEYGSRPSLHGRIGPPMTGVEVRIVNGRIQVRGPVLFDGYLGAPTPIAPLDRDGWFDTGDRGYLDASGALWVLGRDDDTIITGGENVHPGEIEPIIVAHPDIAAACVFGVADPVWGQVIGAAVVGRDTATVDLAELAVFLAPRLPAHKRPRRIAIVASLALNHTGKIDRQRVVRAVMAQLRPVSYH